MAVHGVGASVDMGVRERVYKNCEYLSALMVRDLARLDASLQTNGYHVTAT
jgi:hypothetical protein